MYLICFYLNVVYRQTHTGPEDVEETSGLLVNGSLSTHIWLTSLLNNNWRMGVPRVLSLFQVGDKIVDPPWEQLALAFGGDYSDAPWPSGLCAHSRRGSQAYSSRGVQGCRVSPQLALWSPGRSASTSVLQIALQGLSLGDLWGSRRAPVRDPNTALLFCWADIPGSWSKWQNAGWATCTCSAGHRAVSRL